MVDLQVARVPERNDTRSALLEAASTLMRERATLDITLSDIAEASKANSALVKYYFGNKEGLLFALLERDVGGSLAAMKGLSGMDISPTQKMRLHLQGLFNAYFRYPYTNRLVQAMTRNASPERIARISTEFVQPLIALEREILAAGLACGEFREIDANLFYFQVIGSADSLYSHRFTLSNAFDIAEIDGDIHRRNMGQTVEILMRGIAADR